MSKYTAEQVEDTRRLATLRWQLRFYIIAAVLDVLALGCLISAAILFCLESKP